MVKRIVIGLFRVRCRLLIEARWRQLETIGASVDCLRLFDWGWRGGRVWHPTTGET
jgi:hypothetical protein